MKLDELTLCQKVVLSLFIVCLGLGFLAAQGHMFLTHRGADGKPGLSVRDVQIAFAGDPESVLLKSKSLGNMAPTFLGDTEAQQALITWIDKGARQDTFQPVQQIMDNYCTSCHRPESGVAGATPMTNYQEVALLIRRDSTGITIENLTRLTHIHLIPIAMMFLAMGLIFSGVALGEKWKALIAGVAMVAVLGDVASWWLTRFVWRGFAITIVLFGALMGVTLAMMCLASLVAMWRRSPLKRPNDT